MVVRSFDQISAGLFNHHLPLSRPQRPPGGTRRPAIGKSLNSTRLRGIQWAPSGTASPRPAPLFRAEREKDWSPTPAANQRCRRRGKGGAARGKGIFPLSEGVLPKGKTISPLGDEVFPLDEIDSPSGKTGLFLKTGHSLRVFRVGTGKIRRLAASEGFEFYRDAAGRRCATTQIPKEPSAIPSRPGEIVKNAPVPLMDWAGTPPVPPVAGEQRQRWIRRARTT